MFKYETLRPFIVLRSKKFYKGVTFKILYFWVKSTVDLILNEQKRSFKQILKHYYLSSKSNKS